MVWVPRTVSGPLTRAVGASRDRPYGLPTRLPDARPHAELAGAARPIQRREGRRDPRAPSRGRRTSTPQPTPRVYLGRPSVPQRAEQVAAHAGAPAAAFLAEGPAAGTPTLSPVAGPTRHANQAGRPPHRQPLPE